MTDQKLTASTLEDYKKVFEQANHCIGSLGNEGNDVANRLAATISRRIDEMILDELECLRSLVAEQEVKEPVVLFGGVKVPSPPAPATFEVGDTVRVEKPDKHGNDQLVGKQGKLTRRFTGEEGFEWELDGDFFVDSSELTLVAKGKA